MNAVEQQICSRVDRFAGELTAFAEDLYQHAERGFAEVRTAAKTRDFLKRLGLPTREGIALTGVRAQVGKEDGPAVALLGELDGILCPGHPCAVPETGMSHACGHHAQLAALMGAAAALSDPEVAAALDGRAVLFAVPQEEYLSADVRASLAGRVRYSGGKSELVRLGEFDDIDLALTTHVHMIEGLDCDLLLGNCSATGFIGKTVTLRGRAAHAAAAPHEGVNALNAASLGLSALGLVRETFREKDCVRVHPILKKGGDAVNVVPDEAVVDMMVRARTLEAIEETSRKVSRAFEGAAYAIGARAEIVDAQGYLPVIERPADQVMIDAAALLDGVKVACTQPGMQNFASTDVGDLTHLMPVLNFTFGGATGALHSRDFAVTDPEKLILNPAKLLALTAYRLLRGGAAEAKKLKAGFTPVFTREQYLAYAERLHQRPYSRMVF